MLKINEGKLIKRILTIIISFLLISCEDTMERSDGIFDLAFDMRLTQDSNGYYHLNIDSTRWQTLHKVSGSITENQFGVENFWKFPIFVFSRGENSMSLELWEELSAARWICRRRRWSTSRFSIRSIRVRSPSR